MLSSQDNSITFEQLNSPRFEYIQAELNNWERIIFQGDMDGSRKQGEVSPNTGDHTSTPVNASTDNTGTYLPGNHVNGAALPQVPPEAYNYLIHALLSMQGAIPPPAAYNQSLPYPPGQFSGPSTSSIIHHVPHQAMHSNPPIAMPSTGSLSQFYSNTPGMVTPHSASSHNSRGTVNGPAASVPSNTTPSDPGDITDEVAAIAEDKRRRNTSASARFRIKRKQKTLNLERTVADLTGRTEELEREASELRRENSWLKEIVVLKSRKRGAFGGMQSGSSQQASTSSAQGDGRNNSLSSDEEEGRGKEK
ncbi:uncharacterized protein EDB91DRAFT_269441 [Suillus paluster]|uniref:uncharacterized protein n=1 Tax=Suillus paluster TaxID=48578 RepID=UPI001B868650|nr:uncharacterized protein EDB91DRAFT_269441 [Suillus paluster]KAG1755044.1 hypothetical protein EDB91DRAFT_269441 [Suillus paluster]